MRWKALALIAAVGVLVAIFYLRILPGLSVAPETPSVMETTVATWLLRHSVPPTARREADPVARSPADIAAGQDLFAQKCAICHAYDGSGRTDLGAGMYPAPPVLSTLVPSMADGEIFYHIRHGIRNTAMPAWKLPDRQVWQLVAYLRHLPAVASTSPQPIVADQRSAVLHARYVGSAACKACHQDIYQRWIKTRMANVVRDPRTHPDAIIPDLSKPNPLYAFTRDEVAFVYGSHWKQRYFKKIGDDYFPLPVQWDILNKKWLPYRVPAAGGDWWAAFYPDPGDNSKRPTGPLCDGCHSVNYDIKTKTPSEWNVGCEQCHGAGSAHVAHPVKDDILNPAREDYVHASDTCIACHSQGQPLNNPIAGQYYDWPVGYHAGLNLLDYWKLEPHKLGELTFTHFPDGTAHKNRMQGNDFVQSLMYTRGVTCFSCHDPHGTSNAALLRKPINEICLTCHAPNGQSGPHAVSIQAHTHHEPGSPGSQCVACHMPKIEEQLAHAPDLNVSSHTFRFVTPSDTDAMQIPNACNVCHSDKSTSWATQVLLSWQERSPWRMTK